MVDILLVNSIDFKKNSSIQIGQLNLYEIIKKHYEAELINFDFLNQKGIIKYKNDVAESLDIMCEYIIKKKPKIVGFYTICNSFPISVALSRRLKKRNPDIVIIFGGPHASLTAERCLEDFPFINLISMGEGEITILPLLEKILSHRPLEDLKNIAYRANGKVKLTSFAELIPPSELTEYVVYDYNEFDINENDYLVLEGGRGCPFECGFCSTQIFWQRNFRIKPVEMLLNEMNNFYRLYNIVKFDINHDMFTANKKTLILFCNKLISNEIRFFWKCSSRVDVLSIDLINLMSKANCTHIFFGIETGSSRMQKIIKKNLDLSHALNIFNACNINKIQITLSFIYCFPDETINDFNESITFIEKCFLMNIYNIQLHPFMLFPKTDEILKVREKMYFDKNALELSIFEYNKIFINEILDDIYSYPDLYSQFYTFDNEVRNQYFYFHYLILAISITYTYYVQSIKWVIAKIGLISIYSRFGAEIADRISLYRNQSLESGLDDRMLTTILGDFIRNMLGKYAEECYELRCIFKLECFINDFIEKENSKCLFELDFDYSKICKEQEFILTNKFYFITKDVNKKSINIFEINKKDYLLLKFRDSK